MKKGKGGPPPPPTKESVQSFSLPMKLPSEKDSEYGAIPNNAFAMDRKLTKKKGIYFRYI